MSAIRNIRDRLVNIAGANEPVDPTDNRAWLKDKIAHFEAEIDRLEKELNHVKIMLKGHATWLQDVERKDKNNGGDSVYVQR